MIQTLELRFLSFFSLHLTGTFIHTTKETALPQVYGPVPHSHLTELTEIYSQGDVPSDVYSR